MGEALVFAGGVEGLPMIVVGDPGEDGRLKGEDRGELKDLIGEAMSDVAHAWDSILDRTIAG